MASTRNVRIDENATAISRLIANKVQSTNGITQRSALGDLANKAFRPAFNVGVKKSSANTDHAPVAPSVIDLSKVKPRVNSHWGGAMPRATTAINRSNSLRDIGKTATTNAGTIGGPRLLRSRIGTTAATQAVKYVTTTTRTTRSKSPAVTTVTVTNVMRRQDSTLSRRSLTKLRAGEKVAPVASKVKVEPTAPQEKKENAVMPPAHSMRMILHDDVDAGDEENPLLVSEYVNEIFDYLFALEERYAIRVNHLEGQREVYPKMRSVLIDWINEVHLQYRFTQETFHMAVSLIDRYLQVVSTTSRQNLQLVGVSALFIASKYEELYPPEVKDFAFITDDTYTKHQIIEMEKHILKKLQFELGCPLGIHFLRRFSKVASCDGQTHVMGKYLIELAEGEYKMCHFSRSKIAAASLLISLYISSATSSQSGGKAESVDIANVWTSTLHHYTRYQFADLKPVVDQLISLAIAAPTAKLNHVYTKYSSGKLDKIALKPAEHISLLHKLMATTA